MVNLVLMEITFLGHSSFRIKGKKAIILTDPYNNVVGFKMPQVSADIVTVSHNHNDHNNVEGVKSTIKRKEPFIVDGPGEYEIGGVSILGIASFHDKFSGSKKGENTIYVINLDGMRLVHLGDLGHKLTENQLEEINGVDILFVPIGGNSTLDDNEALAVISQIEPAIVIPMHYRVKETNPDLDIDLTLDDFLKTFGEEKIRPREKLIISKDKLPEEREIIVLERRE